MPLGADDDFNQETITLPTIDRDGQVDALIKSGVAKNDAEKFSASPEGILQFLKNCLAFLTVKQNGYKRKIFANHTRTSFGKVE